MLRLMIYLSNYLWWFSLDVMSGISVELVGVELEYSFKSSVE